MCRHNTVKPGQLASLMTGCRANGPISAKDRFWRRHVQSARQKPRARGTSPPKASAPANSGLRQRALSQPMPSCAIPAPTGGEGEDDGP